MSAQESKFSFGLGGEISGGWADDKNDSDKDIDKFTSAEVYQSGGGGGIIGSFEYRINDLIAAGLKAGFRKDFQRFVMGFETSLFARIYFFRPKGIELFLEPGFGGIFVTGGEGQDGAYMGQTKGFFDFYANVGARFNLGNWYIEPYGGFGYPYWGRLGVMFGYRVPAPKPAAPAPAAPARSAASSASDRVTERQTETPRTVTSSGAQEPIRTIYFPANRTDFTGLDFATVETNNRNISAVVSLLQGNPEYRVLLEGHANPTEGTENEERYELIPLSRQRADAVADMLVAAGANRKQLVIGGSGGLHAGGSAETNRRVELSLLRN
ncbi:MAG: OmpA family protein [Spirochaetaceae bacterium]|nr:OmpA family protein [Spirochaetaceae bacterium]